MKNFTLLTFFIFLLSVMISGHAQDLKITEIMYNPTGSTDSNWEWIEIYNSGTTTIDLSGYVLDDNGGSSLTDANIMSGLLAPQESAILFDADGLTMQEFVEVWGFTKAIEVTRWPSLGNGSGDMIGIWNSFESYDGDQDEQLVTIEQLTYKNGENGWPASDGSASVFLIALDFDNTNGENWSLSTDGVQTPLFNAYISKEVHRNSGSDIGSPGLSDAPIDDTPPTIVCPEAVMVSNEEGTCEAFFPIELPTATDDISASDAIEFTASRSDGLSTEDAFPAGETTISWIAIDEAGNESIACDQVVTVPEEEAPVLICPLNINSVGSGPEVLEIAAATATDNCSESIAVSFERSDDVTLTLSDPFPLGQTMIQWTATDANGNASMCVQTVTITSILSMQNDITNFGFSDQLPGTDIDLTEKTVSLKMPIGTDLTNLSPNISLSAGATVSPETGIMQDFTTPVKYIVTAEDGTSQEWTVIVELEEDDTPPVIACPSNISVDNETESCGAIVSFEIEFSDDISEVELVVSQESGSFFPVGTTEVIATATDEAGNESSCRFKVTVSDIELPIAVCQDFSVQLNEESIAEISPQDVDGGSTDNCSLDSMVVSQSTFTMENLGENEVTLTITDVNGNSSNCTAILTVEPFEISPFEVLGFTLINADTDEPIKDLIEGETIDINDLPTLHLDIRANTSEVVESVRLSLEGALTTARTESLVPFALYRDLPLGDYKGKDFVVGQFQVSATPYSQDGLGGEMGEPYALSFELVDSTPTLSVVSFTLINADTNEPIKNLVEGERIDINSLPTTNLDIRANTTYDVESVQLSISGALNSGRTESLPPYALFQDLPIGNFKGSIFGIGVYAAIGVPFSEDNGKGSLGSSYRINFELVDGDPICSDFSVTVEKTNPSVCNGADSKVVVIPTGGTAPYEVAWTSFSFEGDTVEGLSAGSYMAEVSDAMGCSETITVIIEDPDLPEVTLASFPNVLNTEAPFELSGGMPEEGMYSGESVTNGMFDPSIGPGIYEITYTYIDALTMCSASAVETIMVDTPNTNDIIAFYLVNADNEMDLFPITDGMQIDVAELPTTNLDIRAEVGSDTESVGFGLSGMQSIMRGESLPPYALFQDLPIGDFIGHQFDLGKYTLSGTPYLENSLQGNAGDTLTIDFEFIDSIPTLAITGFTLINAETDKNVLELTDGQEITLQQLPSLFLDIRASTTSDVESVRLELSGQQSTARTESLPPYALFRDLPIGDYIGNTFELGTYTVTAIPYPSDNLSGEMGVPFSITFTIVDGNEMSISPNQAITRASITFKIPIEVEQINIFDMSGRFIEAPQPRKIKIGKSYELDVNSYQQGTYIVKVIDNNGRPYQKQLVVKRH